MKHTKTIGGGGVVLALAVAMLAGCNGDPAHGNPAYKAGVLGNGDFLFACDDGVACLPYSGDAKLFPKAIATGATFNVRFVAKDQEGNVITIDGKKYEGITSDAIAPYVSNTPDGFAAEEPGFGTIIVHDSRGYVVDYVMLTIVKPDDLVVYAADYNATSSARPPQVVSATLPVNGTASYRVVSSFGGNTIAGSIPVDWSSESPDIVAVETFSDHVVNVRAKKAGTAKLTVSGGGPLAKTISIEVTP